MAFARQITVPEPQGSTTSATPSTKSWNYALSYVGRKVSREKPAQLTSTTVVARATSTSSQAVGPAREAVQPYAAIYDYFSRPAHALLHPVSAIEHYWALRAARAEALLGAHMGHKQELDNVSAAHEQRRSVSPPMSQSVSQPRPHKTSQREITDIIAKHDRECSRIRRMAVSFSHYPRPHLETYLHAGLAQWIIAAVAAFTIAMCSYLIFHHVSQNSPSAGRHGTVHFTIPVLSPFTSVVSERFQPPSVPAYLGMPHRSDRTRDICCQCAAGSCPTDCCSCFRDHLAQMLHDS